MFNRFYFHLGKKAIKNPLLVIKMVMIKKMLMLVMMTMMVMVMTIIMPHR